MVSRSFFFYIIRSSIFFIMVKPEKPSRRARDPPAISFAFAPPLLEPPSPTPKPLLSLPRDSVGGVIPGPPCAAWRRRLDRARRRRPRMSSGNVGGETCSARVAPGAICRVFDGVSPRLIPSAMLGLTTTSKNDFWECARRNMLDTSGSWGDMARV